MAETFFSPCPRGLEALLAEELVTFGARAARAVHGGVSWEGDWDACRRANLESRLATRVLWRVGQGRYRAEVDIYKLAYSVTWAKWFTADDTIRIYVTAQKSPLKSLEFITLRVKDAVCDHFRTVAGRRPNVDTADPAVRIHLFLTVDTATLYVDTTGEPLYKRGYKPAAVEAPLKENLAAGLIALSGWTPGTPLADPFCGSGTILIEAGQIAAGIAPGLSRGFGFEALLDHDAALWAGLRADAVRRVQAGAARASAAPIAGSDADPRAIEQARRNAQRAGLAPDALALRCCDVLQARAPGPAPGVVVTNPPYGERLELRAAGSPDAAWGEVGRVLKREFAGWKVFVLTSDARLPAHLGMKEKRRAPLYNGAIECRLFGFEIFARREDSPAPAPAA